MNRDARRWLLVTLLFLLAGITALLYAGYIKQVVSNQSRVLFPLSGFSGEGVTGNLTITDIDAPRRRVSLRLELGASPLLDEPMGQNLVLNGRSYLISDRLLEAEVPLRGSDFYYPHEQYRCPLSLVLRVGGQPVPLALVGLVSAQGFELSARPSGGQQALEFRTLVEVRRAPRVQLFAHCLLALQWLLAVLGLAVAWGGAWGDRFPDPALLVWLTLQQLALFSVRLAYPQGPPWGSYIDFFGYLCCSLLLLACQALLAWRWLIRQR